MAGRQAQEPMAKDTKRDFTSSAFDGVNTQAKRYAIEDGEQAWLENIMPIGDGNGMLVPGISAALATIGAAPYYAKIFSIGSADYMFVACTDGNIYRIGNLATPAYTVTQISTAGNAGKFTKCQMAQWNNTTVCIVDGVNGYYDYTGGVLTAGTAYAPAGARPPFATGQAIATFANRVWVASGRTIYFSNAFGTVVAGSSGLSYNDWTSAGGGLGGSFILQDQTLHSNVIQLCNENNFLYILGEDSAYVISDVQVVSSATVYTKTDLSTGIGTSYPLSLVNYYRTLWWANQSGFFGLYGTAARKGSDALDGVYPLFTGLATTPPALGAVPAVTAGLVTIHNILTLVFFVQYADPVLGITRPLMCAYFNKRWWFASQGPTSGSTKLTMICGGLVAGKNLMYGLDTGGNLYQLFSSDTTDVDFLWQTALWDFGSPIAIKRSVRAGFAATVNATLLNVDTTIDSENDSNTFTVAGGSELVFVGTGPITFIGAASVAIMFLAEGYFFFQGQASNNGRYLGISYSGSGNQTIFHLAALQYDPHSAGWGA
jgi:hypothetical protein